MALALGLALSRAALAGGNAEAGKAKAAQVCAACHSADGSTPTSPQYPVLAGQYYDYLVRVLKDYKSGKRKQPDHEGLRLDPFGAGHRERGGLVLRPAVAPLHAARKRDPLSLQRRARRSRQSR